MQSKILNIITNNDFLRTKSLEVNLPLSNEDRKTVFKMLEYIKLTQDEKYGEKYNLRAGVGLSAIQIGVNKRLVSIYLEENNKVYEYALVNPKIISHSIKKCYFKEGEGCLSVNEDYEGYVHRYYKIKIRSFDAILNKEIIISAKGYLAIVLQHEIDHLNGILYYDHINDNDPYKSESNSFSL